MQIWEPSSRTKLSDLRHPKPSVGPIAFSTDAKTLVGGDSDGVLHFWNVASGSEIAALPAHVSACRSVSFSPDGRCLATADVVDTVRLWSAPSLSEIDGSSKGERHEAR